MMTVQLSLVAAILLTPGHVGPEHSPLSNILGVSAGEPYDGARKKLEHLAEPSKDGRNDSDDQAAFVPKETPYRMVVIHGAHDKVSWISAFLRSPHGTPFSELGDPATGTVSSTLATWEVRTGSHSYRLLAQGKDGHATVITLMAPTLVRR